MENNDNNQHLEMPEEELSDAEQEEQEESDSEESDLEESDSEESEGQQSSTKRKRKRTSKPKRPFPIYSLEEAIKVPKIIREYNGGNPWRSEDVANALKMSLKSNNFFYITASSRDYGFTEGTRGAEKIALAAIGKTIVYARALEDELSGYKQAFLNISLFKGVYEYYDKRPLPKFEYLRNTLVTEFELNEDFHQSFYDIYQANIQFLSKLGESSLGGEKQESLSIVKEHSNDAVILGEPKEKTDLVAFVALPFSERTPEYPHGFFDEVLTQLIIPAAIQAGFKAETAKKKGSDVIQSTIINDLTNADLVIADLTEHNPNVLFELGWRMASDKPVALIRALGTKQIFDVDHMLRVYDYNPKLWMSTLEKDIPALAEHIKGSWANRDSEKSYAKILRER